MLTITSAKITNKKKLEKAIVQAFKQWADTDIDDEHWRYQFLEREWDYDYRSPTIRQNKAKYPNPITSPRNIEDWGTLYESKEYNFSLSSTGALASWHWGATNSSGQEYAHYVHYGTRFMDGRPFTDDIGLASSFWQKDPGQALKMQMETTLAGLNAR